MSLIYLRNENTDAVIAVEPALTGLSDAYLRAGWHVIDKPQPIAAYDPSVLTKAVAQSVDKPTPAEPVITEPAPEPDKIKE